MRVILSRRPILDKKAYSLSRFFIIYMLEDENGLEVQADLNNSNHLS